MQHLFFFFSSKRIFKVNLKLHSWAAHQHPTNDGLDHPPPHMVQDQP